jgi:uncharacterized membrane protein YsdA (DUF1294 family)/cold shock CspA family protein
MAPRSARFHGTITSWNDDRGFGFISLADGDARGDRKTFVHIKAFPAALHRRPQIGDRLSFELGPSAEGKPQAEFVQLAGPTPATCQRHPASRRTSRAASYLPILLFAVGYLAVDAVWPLPIWVAGIYAVASILTYIAYAVDKAAATAGRWRTPEMTLLLLGFLGGWPGAIVAQQMLRHKTRKASFRSAFWGTVAVNAIVLLVFGTPIASVLVSLLVSLT